MTYEAVAQGECGCRGQRPDSRSSRLRVNAAVRTAGPSVPGSTDPGRPGHRQPGRPCGRRRTPGRRRTTRRAWASSRSRAMPDRADLAQLADQAARASRWCAASAGAARPRSAPARWRPASTRGSPSPPRSRAPGSRPPVRDTTSSAAGAEDLDVDDVDPVEHREVDALAGRLAQVLHHRQRGLGQRPVLRHQLAALEQPHPQPVAPSDGPDSWRSSTRRLTSSRDDAVHRRLGQPGAPGELDQAQHRGRARRRPRRWRRPVRAGSQGVCSAQWNAFVDRTTSEAHCQPIDPPGKGATHMSIVLQEQQAWCATTPKRPAATTSTARG